MFEKISLLISILLIIIFIGIYYQQAETVAPAECFELHNDYKKLILSIEQMDFNNHNLSRQDISEIHNTEKHYKNLLSKKFKRTDIDQIKEICIRGRIFLEEYLHHIK